MKEGGEGAMRRCRLQDALVADQHRGVALRRERNSSSSICRKKESLSRGEQDEKWKEERASPPTSR